MSRKLLPLTLLASLASLAVAAPATPAAAQSVPKLPNTTAGTKSCGETSRNGATFRVRVTKGSISCRSARAVVRRKNPYEIKGWDYFDWTKGGNGPWSDVYVSKSRKTVIGAIMRG